MSDSVRPLRWQPTRLPRPWDSPGKNTGVGCHFLLQCMKVKSESEVTQSCPTLSEPIDCSLPGSSVHGIFPGKSTGVGCHCLLQNLSINSSNSSENLSKLFFFKEINKLILKLVWKWKVPRIVKAKQMLKWTKFKDLCYMFLRHTNRLVPNRKRSTSRLYIVTLLI